MKILVDTSVWIDFFKGKNTLHVKALEALIEQGEDVCICGVILTEILQGIREDKIYQEVVEHLDNLIFLPMERDIYIAAADLYRQLRKKGITIRKPVDCMIAAVAIHNKAMLLHNDRDFDSICRDSSLKSLTR